MEKQLSFLGLTIHFYKTPKEFFKRPVICFQPLVIGCYFNPPQYTIFVCFNAFGYSVAVSDFLKMEKKWKNS